MSELRKNIIEKVNHENNRH